MDELKVKLNMTITNGTESNKVVMEFKGTSARRVISAITGEMMGIPPTAPTKETITSFDIE